VSSVVSVVCDTPYIWGTANIDVVGWCLQDIKYNPHKYMSNTSIGVQASGRKFPLKSFPLYFLNRWDVVCFYIHWVVQNTRQHHFLIHASSVYTICVLFLFFSLSVAIYGSSRE
jgi:hypothetical protein